MMILSTEGTRFRLNNRHQEEVHCKLAEGIFQKVLFYGYKFQ